MTHQNLGKIERGNVSLKSEWVGPISRALGVEPGDLFRAPSEPDAAGTVIRVAGLVGAGAQVEAIEGPVKYIEVPVAWTDATAFQVSGDSCYPTYEDEDFILVRGERRFVPEECEGKMCVIETGDGLGYVKRLFDDGRGTFTLESPNAQPLRRIEVVAARPIKLRLDPTEVKF